MLFKDFHNIFKTLQLVKFCHEYFYRSLSTRRQPKASRNFQGRFGRHNRGSIARQPHLPPALQGARQLRPDQASAVRGAEAVRTLRGRQQHVQQGQEGKELQEVLRHRRVENAPRLPAGSDPQRVYVLRQEGDCPGVQGDGCQVAGA